MGRPCPTFGAGYVIFSIAAGRALFSSPIPAMRTLLLSLSLTVVACLSLTGFAAAQPYTVQGRVTDPDAVPLAGVNVLEKGTTRGTTTDVEGRYRFTYADPSAVLVFSYVGF